ncbi:hypothetical protein SHKM778_28960 [Streptomyces sp. KM77-8]|uniref:Uncharacterized protein n=1 Tax=Streptomyces haneummycinicus TaxID=3074435 RepID=A0AAT9HGH4_9ACTN
MDLEPRYGQTAQRERQRQDEPQRDEHARHLRRDRHEQGGRPEPGHRRRGEPYLPYRVRDGRPGAVGHREAGADQPLGYPAHGVRGRGGGPHRREGD